VDITGEYISLGYHEQDDVAAAVAYLTQTCKITRIGLWGRSMGAATSIIYSATNAHAIQAMILDSPFCSLRALSQEVLESLQVWCRLNVIGQVN
jgi:alpha-beta hydrolase superfamily lysophospholipase